MWSNGEAQTEILGKNLSSSTLPATSSTRTRLRVNMGCCNKRLAVTRHQLGLWQVMGTQLCLWQVMGTSIMFSMKKTFKRKIDTKEAN
jgi:hypothetical protein